MNLLKNQRLLTLRIFFLQSYHRQMVSLLSTQTIPTVIAKGAEDLETVTQPLHHLMLKMPRARKMMINRSKQRVLSRHPRHSLDPEYLGGLEKQVKPVENALDLADDVFLKNLGQHQRHFLNKTIHSLFHQ